MYIGAGLVTLGDVVALVPPILPPYLNTLGHRLIERSGLALPIANYVALDPETGYVIETEPVVRPSDAALARLDALAPSSNGARPAAANGPLRADIVCFLGLPEEAVLPYSPGNAAHVLASRLLNLDEIGGAAVETLGRFVEDARCCEIRSRRQRRRSACSSTSCGRFDRSNPSAPPAR